MRWPVVVPLLVTQARGPAFRNPDGGGRISPGGEKFERAACVALGGVLLVLRGEEASLQVFDATSYAHTGTKEGIGISPFVLYTFGE